MLHSGVPSFVLRRLLAGLALIGAIGAAGPAPAQTSDLERALFTVDGVEVEATGASAAAARDTAFLRGQRDALERLAGQVGAPGFDAGAVSEAQLNQVIQSVRMSEERTSPGRYAGTMSVVFRPEETRRLFGQAGIGLPGPIGTPGAGFGQALGIDARPALVLPVFRSDGRAQLWDRPNPWLDVWLDYDRSVSFVPILSPYGELSDLRIITVEAALEGDRAAIRNIANQYEAADAVVVIAEPREDSLQVTVRRYGPNIGTETSTLNIDEGDSLDERMTLATGRVAALLEQDWRDRAQRLMTAERRTIQVVVPLAGADHWFRIRSQLERVNIVSGTELLSLTPREAVLRIAYLGTQEDFEDAIGQNNLRLGGDGMRRELRLASGF